MLLNDRLGALAHADRQIRTSSPRRADCLGKRLRDPEWRRYGGLLVGGKLTALSLLLLAVYLMNPGLLGMRTLAADPVVKSNDLVNPLNTVWTLVAAFLVFGMQVGFTMLEAASAGRAKR